MSLEVGYHVLLNYQMRLVQVFDDVIVVFAVDVDDD
jgi:hypothetical protein